MEESLLLRGKRESRHLLLKLGLALALSLAGYFASQFRPKSRLTTSISPQGDDEPKKSSNKTPKVPSRGLKDELEILSNEEAFAKIITGTSSKSSRTTQAAVADEGLLLPEFNKFMMKEFEEHPVIESVQAVSADLELEEKVEMEKEIKCLRNLLEALKERERNLEVQLIEYYGLKEQEVSLQELENRLKVKATEHKLLRLKIESLQIDNHKLQAQVSDYSKIVSELEVAREEIKLLKKKMKLDGEQAKEKLASLHQRITEMLDRERKQGADDAEVEKKVKELEDEVVDLRKVNARLAEENLKFAQQLGSIRMELSSNSKQSEVEAFEEAKKLREDNENLKKEIEQLQTDRCADVEELVYLKWVNACLRYELRNYQPAPGKTVAKDLSKCLSPESEKKAKQLILEYATSGTIEKNSNDLIDFDTESCSSSLTSSEDYSDTSIDICSSTKTSRSSKSKLFSKIKKLVLGKDNQREQINSVGNSMWKASVSPSSEDTGRGRSSSDCVYSCISVENTSTNYLNGSELHSNHQWQTARSLRQPRQSLDVQRLRKLDLGTKESIAERCKSDLGTSNGHMRVIAEDCLSDLSLNFEHQHADAPEKLKLKKFANVFNGARGPVKPKKSRQASFSSA